MTFVSTVFNKRLNLTNPNQSHICLRFLLPNEPISYPVVVPHYYLGMIKYLFYVELCRFSLDLTPNL